MGVRDALNHCLDMMLQAGTARDSPWCTSSSMHHRKSPNWLCSIQNLLLSPQSDIWVHICWFTLKLQTLIDTYICLVLYHFCILSTKSITERFFLGDFNLATISLLTSIWSGGCGWVQHQMVHPLEGCLITSMFYSFATSQDGKWLNKTFQPIWNPCFRSGWISGPATGYFKTKIMFRSVQIICSELSYLSELCSIADN